MRLNIQIVVDSAPLRQLADWLARTKDEVRRELEVRGVTFLWKASQGPRSWHTIADPAGNPVLHQPGLITRLGR